MATLAELDSTGTLRAGKGEAELADRRTRTAKLFHLGGRRYRIGAGLGPIHYRRDPFDRREALKDIDLSLSPSADADLACEHNGYQVRLWGRREVGGRTFHCAAEFRRAGRWLAMAPVALAWTNDAGERQVIARPEAGEPEVEADGSRARWRDAFGAGIGFWYTLLPDRFFKVVEVRERAALPRPTIGTAGLRLAVVMALAWDSEARAENGFAAAQETTLSDDEGVLDAPDELLHEPEPYAHRDALDRPVWWMQRPRAWDSAPEEWRDWPMEWELRRLGGTVCAVLSLPAEAVKEATFPLLLDTAISEEQVGASTDDAIEYGSTYPGYGYGFYTDRWNEFGASSHYFWHSGQRFQTIPIPQGATINSATLSYRCAQNTIDQPADAEIACEDVDDSQTFGSGHKPHDAWNQRTSNTARWQTGSWTAGNWYDSSDVSAPVQEVINRTGWSSNNDLTFIIYNRSSSKPGTYELQDANCYDNSASYAPKFNCTYTAAGGGFDALLLAGD